MPSAACTALPSYAQSYLETNRESEVYINLLDDAADQPFWLYTERFANTKNKLITSCQKSVISSRQYAVTHPAEQAPAASKFLGHVDNLLA